MRHARSQADTCHWGGITLFNLLSSPQTWKVKRSLGRRESVASSPPTSRFTLLWYHESSKRATWLDQREVRWQVNWCHWSRPRFLRRQSPKESAWGCRWDGTMRKRKEKEDRIVNACACWMYFDWSWNDLITSALVPSFPDLVFCCFVYFAFYIFRGAFCFLFHTVHAHGTFIQLWTAQVVLIMFVFIFNDVFLVFVFMSLTVFRMFNRVQLVNITWCEIFCILAVARKDLVWVYNLLSSGFGVMNVMKGLFFGRTEMFSNL